MDFNFLRDMAYLVLAARRTLSYTYAIRFYLKGLEKQQFFDFLVKDLERTLETLTKYSEEKWSEYLEFDSHGLLIMAKKFFEYKTKVNSVRQALEMYFNKTMVSIQNGLPEVPESKKTDNSDYNFVEMNGAPWTCRNCRVLNGSTVPNC